MSTNINNNINITKTLKKNIVIFSFIKYELLVLNIYNKNKIKRKK